MDLELKDKVVVVTGGSMGIGAACVEGFAAEGSIPVIIDRSPREGNDLVERLGRGKVIEAELISDEACRKAIEETLETFGRIDGIVHNAGGNDVISLRSGVNRFVESLHRNLIHVYALTHYALDALIEAKGFVVNVSSKVAETGQGGTSGYAASKGAMNALTREWALDLAQHGIRVNAVAPAEVLTPMYEEWARGKDDPEGYLSEVCERIPLGQRMTSPKEIANAVVFLASEKSGHTTGQIVHPDGGYVHLDRSYRNGKNS
ncbi:MAG: SDR family oxidoreductase [Akkermansiaceae bacterium]